MKRVETLEKIKAAGVVAVVRAETAEKAVKVSQACVDGGVKGIELTFTVPHADLAIGDLTDQYAGTDVMIGAGTVLDAAAARLAIDAGAQFVVSPAFDKDVALMCNLYQVPYLPGCYSITEITTALKYGSDIIKLFPGSLAGPGAVKAIKAPLPQVSIMPTGGVNLDNMKDWFAAGVVVVGAGSGMVKPADHDDFAGVTANAKAYMAEFAKIKQQQ
ncbi:keto-hydroxyglutarate-aldolase keto-deoxy-phosphogluconate aldolase [Agrilactobacillus composti DSM 18527 = JCM 14202]|uniref:Keto-hydroxyglutarate-aldolase keto-deoxy-phosphogluconate aldolase n=1 Tax=Agrilactobacillus composti DSM 18527 = JCM 14202 TaxID=1423734 RepID=X0PF65_9LACO|nr:bifunctional 2-keto-4-hydroxyglutarate aldolase/2-keto-3-deoxy-6-phosphogluconate aldolase [Agrilactobacillus composti]KRM35076.1 keto-hydroxyglutarate-aldolase keto-deoxy-phosphogluconate aldolase [Agrilactobacillus composti DSM 18527 = JCM 14202]GAF40479.1 4-hydroxy-2-oxoglutarate aldolase [Agrilactobacillus composti DSM 18527 = JCM 14202]